MDIRLSQKSQFILQIFLLIIPVNIFLLGEGIAAGLQWVLARYQQSYLGNSIIFFTKDISYIQMGILTGKSALAAGISFFASVLIIVSIVLMLFAIQEDAERWIKCSALMIIGSGFLFLISDMLQYGPFFHGPSGFVIPIGVPVFFLVGLLIYFGNRDNHELDESGDLG